MTALSALEAIETSIGAQLLLVSGMQSAKAVAINEMPGWPQTDEKETLTMPDLYPGCIYAVNDDEVELTGNLRAQNGTARANFRVPVYIAVFANSDGTQYGEARRKAWQMAELIHKQLVVFVPSGFPTNVFNVDPSVMTPAKESETLFIDHSTHGMLLKFWAHYQIAVP